MARLLVTLAFLLLVFLSSTMAAPGPAPSCAAIETKLTPCIPYIEGRTSGDPSSACCAGVESIAAEIMQKGDQVEICNCVKNVLVKLGNKVISAKFTNLPKKCGIPYTLPPINQNFDCSKIP